MRVLPAFVGLLALAGCAIPYDPGSKSDAPVISALPQWITGLPGDGPDFGVAGLQPGQTLPTGYAGFNNAGAEVPARHAAQICTLGYQVLEQGTAPGDVAAFAEQRIRCNAYRPSF